MLLYELLLCGGMLGSLLADTALMHIPNNWRWMVGLPVLPAAVLAGTLSILDALVSCCVPLGQCKFELPFHVVLLSLLAFIQLISPEQTWAKSSGLHCSTSFISSFLSRSVFTRQVDRPASCS